MEFICPCGTAHEFAASSRLTLEKLITEHGEYITVENGRDRYRIPRVYIAAHGIREIDLADLAKQYRWPHHRMAGSQPRRSLWAYLSQIIRRPNAPQSDEGK